MRRTPRVLRLAGAAVLVTLSILSLVGAAGPAGASRAVTAQAQTQIQTQTQAQTETDGVREVIDVVQVSGLIDNVVLDDIDRRLDELASPTDDRSVLALVLQVNSPGVVIGDDVLVDLLDRLDAAPVPVGVWVGPAGSSATGKSAYLLSVADWSAISIGSRIGDLGDPIDDTPTDILGSATLRLRTDTVGRAEARDLELVDTSQDVLGEFILSMMDNGIVPERIEVIEPEDGEGLVSRAPSVPVRFNRLSVIDQFFHTVASPPVAYLMLLAGLGLLLLEFYTAGVGVAGVVGAGCLLCAGYGLGALPLRPWALVLLVLSTLAFAVDVQTGVPRFWTGVGIVFLVFGSVFLFTGPDVSWITLIAGIGGMLLLVFTGLPNLVRTRFGTTTIGRDWMIGEIGTAVSDIDPDGTIELRGAQWPARTNRATPIAAGGDFRVAHLDGPIVEVEPLEGAARDHRERRRS